MSRRHDIDALRVIAFALLIFYHTAMAYVGDWDFHLKSAYTREWLQWPMIALNRWRMPLLFMISGIAIGLAHPEHQPWRMAWRRSVRLLLPLLFGMFVVVSVQAYCEGMGNGKVAPGFAAFLWRYWQVRPWPAGSFTGWEHGITWNHLWYLAYLWLYTLVLLAAIALGRPLWRRSAHLCAGIAPRLAGDAGAALLILLPVAWLAFAVLVVLPGHPPTHALLGDWFVHAESFPLLVLGCAIARSQGFWTQVQRRRRTTLLIAVAALTIELAIRYLARNRDIATLPFPLAELPWYTSERLARATYTWCALLALFGWAKTLLDRPFAWLPYCSQAVFPWYVLHQSLIIVLLYWLAPMQLGPWLEPAMVLAGTVAGCLLLHELLIRRIAWLRPLFGLPLTPPPAACPAACRAPDGIERAFIPHRRQVESAPPQGPRARDRA